MADITVEVTSPGSATTWGYDAYGNNAWNQITGVLSQTGNETVFTDVTVQLNSNLLNLTLSSPDVFIGVLVEPNSFLINSTVNSVFGGESIIVEVTTPGSPTTWGEYAWNQQAWGQVIGTQSEIGDESVTGELNAIALVTTNLLNINVGNIEAFGLAIVDPSGIELTTSSGNVFITIDINVNVNTNLLNLSLGDESITASGTVDLIGNQLNTNVGNLSTTADANLNVNTNLLNTTVGSVDHIIDAIVEVNSPGNLPWGATYWNYGTWGNIGGMDVEQGGEEVVVPSIEVDVTGQELTTNTGTLFVTGNANVDVNTNLLTTAVGSVDNIIDVDVLINTNLLNTSTGTLSITGTGTVNLVGNQLNTSTGTLSITGTGTVNLNTNLLTTSLGDEDGVPNTIVILSTNLLNVSVGNASGQALVDVSVTSVTITPSTGRLFVSGWAVINIGVSNTWTVVDIAA